MLLSYLEACYDRKIAELCGIVEETLGVNRKKVKLNTKVLPRLEHHVATANRVSKKNMEVKTKKSC